ncbi:MAG: hypothetical protein V1678_05505 [Candidatus Aenigmatarchaeota archaeon]
MTVNNVEKEIGDVLSKWLTSCGYECFYNFPLGGKFPDLLAIKGDELVAFELKSHANEIPMAMGQCLFYLNEANRAFIVIPFGERALLGSYVFKTLNNHGIGLIAADKDVKQLVDARSFSKDNSLTIGEIRGKNNPLKARVDVKEEILDTLSKHPEGITTIDIAKYIGMSRHSVTNYVYNILGEGLISQRNIGMARLCFLKEESDGK